MKKKYIKPFDKESGRVFNKLRRNEHVLRMKNFTQHGSVSTFEHCRSVAKMSLAIDRKFSLKADKKTLITGAMLHDFFLYDWHDKTHKAHRLHGFTHAAHAAKNASELLNIDAKTKHIIASHMWPLNITRVPRSREAWIVCLADKIVALNETIRMRKKH